MLNLHTRVCVRSDLLAAEVDGEVVMMDAQSGHYFALDAIGARIWGMLASPIELFELCKLLESQFDASLGTIQQDVLALMSDLHANGLIKVEP